MKVSNPEKPLNPAIEMTKADYFCTKIAPYLIIICIIILTTIAFVAMVKYGANITGTEANTFQRLELMI